ncbi:MAG TPA: hypothetical protein IAB46_06565 [Candidatus Scybalocola faecigallinarum]|uniref:Uncharacterized protein n=1 Tax=Candidatus Scybalocola faecigallinarum TaxID=2840941 RepID=A0A9D1F4B3_9FIRM|nr:hypothetical protein [Candidatus Scybalocola faecigallinarum]
MKEDYIRQVQKKLILPGKKKQAIIRDLQEAFESGAEHGESEDQVIRMSMPPQNAIGGADAMTSIQVVRTMPDPTLLLAIIGIGALITAIVFAVLSRRK